MLYPEWISVWDRLPEETVSTRRELLGRAAREKALIFGSHLRFPGLGTVSEEGKGWRWKPVEI